MRTETNPQIPCRICGEPVSLKADAVADEDGKAVHEQCYVTKITSSTGTKEEALSPKTSSDCRQR
jgi:hypothetical protein